MALSVSAARSRQIQALGLQAVQLDEQHGLPVLLVQQVVQTRAVQQGLCGLYAAQPSASFMRAVRRACRAAMLRLLSFACAKR